MPEVLHTLYVAEPIGKVKEYVVPAVQTYDNETKEFFRVMEANGMELSEKQREWYFETIASDTGLTRYQVQDAFSQAKCLQDELGVSQESFRNVLKGILKRQKDWIYRLEEPVGRKESKTA